MSHLVAKTGRLPAAVMETDAGAACPTRYKSRTLLAYGGLALPLSLAEVPIVLYLPAFYAQELRLKTAMVGAVFLLARCWDAISDMLVGWLSDRTTYHLGRRKTWIMGGAPFLCASTWFLCNPSKSAGLTYLCVWAIVFYTSFTAVKIPHLSLGTELATDYVERTRVSTYREAFTMVGYLLFVAVPLIFLSDDPPLHEVLLLLCITTLITIPLTTLCLSVWVPDRLPRENTRSYFLKDMAILVRDRVLVRYVIARLIFATEEGVSNSLLVFSFTVGLALTTRLFFWTVLILYVTTLCTMPLTLRLARSVEKHRVLAAGVSIQALVYFTLIWIPAGHFAVVALLYVAIGISNTAMLSLPTSMLADIIDRGEATNGIRRSGSYVAVDNLLYKVGMALGVGLSFGLLAWVGYDPANSNHGLADMRWIRLLGFGVPSVLSIPVVLLYATHPITRKVHRQLREQIEFPGKFSDATQVPIRW
jgi:GPH family glycoside/pentoside/hexuronide:cation symporter